MLGGWTPLKGRGRAGSRGCCAATDLYPSRASRAPGPRACRPARTENNRIPAGSSQIETHTDGPPYYGRNGYYDGYDTNSYYSGERPTYYSGEHPYQPGYYYKSYGKN